MEETSPLATPDTTEKPEMPETQTAVQTQSQSISAQSLSVDIYDQIYHLRGTDPEYIARLAQSVDAKMRAVSAHGGTVDSLRVAVLAALNIADELATLRQRYESLAGSVSLSQTSMRSRAGSLAGMLDEVLEDRKVG